MSQQFIADYCCVARETVANWESGHRLPNIVTIKILADLFNISIEQLIGCKERYYVLASSLYNEKLTDTSALSYVLRIIKGIATVLIMVPLLISIPLKTKENEERRLYHDIVNNNASLILQVKYSGIVEEYTFNRIDSNEIKNITNQYNISEPNHENIECGFSIENLFIDIKETKIFYNNNQFHLNVLTVLNEYNNKVVEIEEYKNIQCESNDLILIQDKYHPHLQETPNHEIYFFISKNSFYIGALKKER